MPPTYADVLARNIRAARAAADIQQESVAVRMRALGFDAWIRQTVGSTERGRRRVTAEEVLGLAYALQTSVAALMSPSSNDQGVALPSGAAIDTGSIQYSARGFNDGSVRWDGDVPVFVGPQRAMHHATGGQWVRMSPEAVGQRGLDTPGLSDATDHALREAEQ